MKKFLCILLAAISIFSLILPAFAADGEQGSQINTDVDLSKSTITEDFQKVFGGEFKVEDYPYNSLDLQEKNIYLITCVENYVHDRKKSEMYFYLYNPTKKEIDITSENNKVRASYSRNEDEVSYCDYNLTYVNSDCDGVLMKFKVKGFFTNLAFDQDERAYTIAGIELVTKGSSTAIDYGVGKEFTFRDNELGFTLQAWKEIDTVQTEVKHTYYRLSYDSDSVDKGDSDRYYDIRTVYFNVPNEVIGKYGYINSLKCEWEECLLFPVFVTNKNNVANVLSKYVNSPVNSNEELMFYYNFYASCGSLFSQYYLYGFNYIEHFCNSFANEYINQLGGVYSTELGIFSGLEWLDGEVKISSSKLMESQDEFGWDDVNFRYIDKSNFGKNAQMFNVYSTSSGGMLAPDALLSLLSNNSFREFIDTSMSGHSELFCPLKIVTAEDLILSKKEFSEKFFVDIDDVDKIKENYNENDTLYVLNYSITDYAAYTDVDFCYGPVVDGEELDDDDFKCFVADVTAIRNFDLIEANYELNGIVTILPFVSNPTNHVTGVVAKNSGWKPPLWLVILIICVVVLIAVKIYKKVRKARSEKKFERKYLK